MKTYGQQENYQAFNYNQGQQAPSKTTDLYGSARTNFIRKVYTVLLIQLAITVLFCALSMYNMGFFMFQIANIWLFYVAIVVAITVQIYMFCCNGGRTVPSNYICLGIFTLAESYTVSFVCSITGYESGNQVVFLAAVFTLGIVIACTLYATYTQTDFTTCYGMIVVLSAALFILLIVTLFTDSPFMRNLYCCLGVIVFGFYLIIDTQMIMGGRTIELSIDEYAIAAMILYIDIIQIFLYLLQLLSKK